MADLFRRGNKSMSRLEWLKWMLRYGNPQTRTSQLQRFFIFEMYYLCYKLSGYKLIHWLEQPSLPEGTYLRVKRLASLATKLLDRIFVKGEYPVEYISYTPEAAEELSKAGRHFELVNISHRLGGRVSQA